MNVETGFIESNGARLYYEAAGTGPALVMVHAGIADSRMWDNQFLLFAESFRTIRYDLRGHGQSQMVAGEYASRDDLHTLIQSLGIARCALMGASRGGETVIDFAIEHPEMVLALVPVASALSGFPYEGELPPYWEEMEAAERSGDVEKAAEYSVRIWIDTHHRSSAQVDRAMREKVIEMCRLALRQSNGLGKHIAMQPPAFDRLSTLQVPILSVCGSLDDPNFQRIADLLGSLPSGRKLVLQNTAHLPSMERPQEFNQIVLSFLKSVLLT
jgi:3-oxoadipate enol-lactonase